MERRIRPIYDALDSRNPKQALKLCDALLKKVELPLVKALKAVAFERMGRVDEALALAREVGANLRAPVDGHLLNTLLIPFRAANKLGEAVGVYESAYRAEPDSEELADELFSAYLRAAEYAKAQQLAMKIYKAQGASEQLYGAMCCLVLQVDAMGPPRQPTRHYADEPPPPEAATHLQLASAMMGRAAGQKKLTTASQLRLYLEVLRRRGAHEDALALLSEHGALLGNPAEVLQERAALLEKLDRTGEARDAHAALLQEHVPDNWDAYRGLLRGAALEASTRERLDSLSSAHPKLRGPVLAGLYLTLHAANPAAAEAALRCSSHTVVSGAHTAPAAAGALAADAAAPQVDVSDVATDDEALSTETRALITQLQSYFARFGEKTVCALDTLPLVASLAPRAAARRALLAPLETDLPAAAPPTPPDLSWLRRFICLQQWRLGCGATAVLSASERSGLARTFNELYTHHAPLSADLDARERGHGDLLPLLGAQLLMNRPTADWFASSGSGVHAWDLTPLLGATLSLRHALSASPHNFQLALGLVACYQCLGAPSCALDVYRRLNVKFVQNESLAYIMLPSLDTLGAAGLSAVLLSEVRRFQSNGLSELPDNLALAIRSGSYSQALEFVALKRSLEHSWWHTLTDVLHALSILRANAANAAIFISTVANAPFLAQSVTREALGKLPDPTDLAVYEEHAPHQGVHRVASLQFTWLPRRVLLLRALYHAMRAAPRVASANPDALNALTESASALSEHVNAPPSRSDRPAAATDCSEHAEDWRPLVTMVQLTALLVGQPAGSAASDEGGATPAGEGGADDASVVSAIEAFGMAAVAAIRACTEGLSAEGGFAPTVIASVAHVQNLVLPTMCVLCPRWASLLPGEKKKKAEATEATETAAAPGRAAMRAALDNINDALSALQVELKAAAAKPSAACARLTAEEAGWNAFLGGGTRAGEARASVCDELAAAHKVSLGSFVSHLKELATALKASGRGV